MIQTKIYSRVYPGSIPRGIPPEFRQAEFRQAELRLGLGLGLELRLGLGLGLR